jgi:hypothetical protein
MRLSIAALAIKSDNVLSKHNKTGSRPSRISDGSLGVEASLTAVENGYRLSPWDLQGDKVM